MLATPFPLPLLARITLEPIKYLEIEMFIIEFDLLLSFLIKFLTLHCTK